MAVLLDVAIRRVVFALHAGNVADAHHLSRQRVAVNDLVGHLLFAVLCRLDMDECLLVVVGELSGHRGQALRLQGGHQRLLSDAECFEPLPIHIEAHLLLVLTILPHIRHRRNLAQAVGEAVAIVLQLAIAALLALYGNEQGRSVSEIVVGNQRQHTAWQTLLVEGQTVLDLAPHLVLVVHFVF